MFRRPLDYLLPAAVLTIAGLVAANLLFAVIGAGVLAAARITRTTGSLVERWGLAPLTGMATVGIIGTIFEPLHLGVTVPVVIALALASIVLLALRLERAPRTPRPPWLDADRIVGVAAAIGLVAVGAVVALTFWVKPIVEYDSWAMWAMKARALAAFGWADPQVFEADSYRALHLEYPLVLPVIHAVGIRAAGSYEGRLVILQCLLIGGAGLLALWAVLRDRARPAVLLPCILAIAIVPGMFGQLATAYADVPLALFVGVAVAAAARWLVDLDNRWLIVATLFLIAAALTKNEGLLFATAAFAGLILAAAGRRRVTVLLAGLAFGLAILPWRVHLSRAHLSGRDYDLSSSFAAGGGSQRVSRGLEAAHRLVQFALDPDRFGFLLPFAVAAAAIALVVGLYRLGAFLITFLTISLAGLTWVYAISGLDLDGYLRASGDRVVTGLVLGGASVGTVIFGELGGPDRPTASSEGPHLDETVSIGSAR